MSNQSIPGNSKTTWVEQPAEPSGDAAGTTANDGAFMTLLAAYRRTGGIARRGEIAARCSSAGQSHLACQISDRSVLSFEWQDENWLPVFQFESATSTVKPAMQILMSEFSGSLGGWELAQWFVQPNTLLDREAPLPLLDRQFARVHQAARILRNARRTS